MKNYITKNVFTIVLGALVIAACTETAPTEDFVTSNNSPWMGKSSAADTYEMLRMAGCMGAALDSVQSPNFVGPPNNPPTPTDSANWGVIYYSLNDTSEVGSSGSADIQFVNITNSYIYGLNDYYVGYSNELNFCTDDLNDVKALDEDYVPGWYNGLGRDDYPSGRPGYYSYSPATPIAGRTIIIWKGSDDEDISTATEAFLLEVTDISVIWGTFSPPTFKGKYIFEFRKL